MSGLIQQILVATDIFQSTSRWLLAIINSKVLEVVDMQEATDAQMMGVLDADPTESKERSFPTLMWGVAQNSTLPPEKNLLSV